MDVKSIILKIAASLTFLLLLLGCSSEVKKPDQVVSWWLTTGDKSALLASQPTLKFGRTEAASPTITVDTTQVFQTIDGFGYALTGGSAMLMNTKLNEAQRSELLKELFLTDGNSIGLSYLRVSIGGSDLDELIFSYDDLPKGKTDPELKSFTLSYDTMHLIPVLKEILTLNPTIKIMGSPWSPPVWMKDNNLPKGGSLKPEYYEVYALSLIHI